MTTLQDDLNQFFDALFDPTDTVELRFLPPMKTKSNQWYQFPGMIVNEWDDVAERNKRQDTYFGVNPRMDRGGTASSIDVCRCVFADFDHTTTETAIETINKSGLPEPTVLVNSGHGAHAYWRLEDEIDVPQWRAIQRGLIELLKCDDKIHDAPRIMRLPGTAHVAKHENGTDRKYCVIVSNRMTTHDIEDIVRVLPVVEAAQHEDVPGLPDGECAVLPPWVNRFLISGTDAGNRNATTFDVACAMKGAGWPIEKAKPMILAAAERCTPPLSQGEALSAVKSAYSKERSPAAQDTESLPLGSAWQIAAMGASVPQDDPQDNSNDDESSDGDGVMIIGDPAKNGHVAIRSAISNVMETVDKEGTTIRHPKTVQQIVASLHEATGDWPRRAGGMLFVPGEVAERGELPPPGSVRVLDKVDKLFAWMHAKTSLYWADGQKCTDQLEGSSRTSLKRGEFFEHMQDTCKPAYDGAEVLPHHPPAPRVWYAPCILQRSSRSMLSEFCDRLNWQTEKDRGLMEAALLTMFWGGGCGQRPAFVFSSKHGAGAGKTTSVGVLTRVAGGHIEMGQKESIEEFAKRLLSDAGLSTRALLIDNVKSKMDVAGLEALITAEQISGHRMYHGHASRPNRLTWFVTANAPKLSHDLTERSYNVQIGSQRTDAKWQAELHDWIDANRPKLVASCIEALQHKPLCVIEDQNLDRWARWQCEVLARVENGNEIAAAMRERRSDMDADQDDAEDIALVAKALMRLNGQDPDTSKAFMAGRVLADAIAVWQGDDNMGRRRTVSWINNRVGNGSLKQLRQTKYRGERGYQWIGEACVSLDAYTTILTDMPPDFRAEDVRMKHDE